MGSGTFEVRDVLVAVLDGGEIPEADEEAEEDAVDDEVVPELVAERYGEDRQADSRNGQ